MGGVLVIDACDADCCDRTAFKAAHQHPAQGIAKSGGLAALEGANQKHAGLGAVLVNLMLDAIDLVLQHGLMRNREQEPKETDAASDATALRPAATVMWQGSDITNQCDLQSGNLKGSDGGFTT